MECKIGDTFKVDEGKGTATIEVVPSDESCLRCYYHNPQGSKICINDWIVSGDCMAHFRKEGDDVKFVKKQW